MKRPRGDTDSLIVVGGGITGLMIGYFASDAGLRVTILESQARTGGLMSTTQIGGTRLEKFYHHFFTHDAELLWLLDRLQLQDRVLFRPTRMGVFSDGRTFDFNTPRDLFRIDSLNSIDVLRFLISSVYLGRAARWRCCEGRPCVDWLRRWAGANTTDFLWLPLLRVKFGPYADQIPLAWMVGRLRQRMRSRKMGREQLGYLNGSLEVLHEAIRNKLAASGAEVITDIPAIRLIGDRGRVSGVYSTLGEHFADKTILTVPTTVQSKLVENLDSGMASRLKQIRYFGAICVVVETTHSVTDVYWLNIADKDSPFGCVIEQTNFLQPADYGNRHVLYLSRYHAENEEIAGWSDRRIRECAIRFLSSRFSKFRRDYVEGIKVFRSRHAAVLTPLNFSTSISPCRSPIENLFHADMTHVYPDERSVNNSIRVAHAACIEMGIPVPKLTAGESLSASIGFRGR